MLSSEFFNSLLGGVVVSEQVQATEQDLEQRARWLAWRYNLDET